VIAKAKNGGALLSVVAANTFENRGAVADDVRKDMNIRVVPLDKLSVMPNLFGFRDGHQGCSGALARPFIVAQNEL
jgi:hypothetical protein